MFCLFAIVEDEEKKGKNTPYLNKAKSVESFKQI